MIPIVIHPSWIDGLPDAFPGFPLEAMEQLHRGEVVHFDGLGIVAQHQIPMDLEPQPRPIDAGVRMAELRRHLRNGWRSR
ncbi:hypothetical protein [Delftia lacustris]|jgi:hypothetical protein|uniref:hypothetical protein n=1 Tax=Delftia lacustris TaxID=558537 RepID=UPI000640884B|nr:hypothetical protein [Delftia lacustris]